MYAEQQQTRAQLLLQQQASLAGGALACCNCCSCHAGRMGDENQESPMMLQQTQAGENPHTNTLKHQKTSRHVLEVC